MIQETDLVFYTQETNPYTIKNVTPVHPPYLFTFGERVNVLEKLVRKHATRPQEAQHNTKHWVNNQNRQWRVWKSYPCVRRNCIFLGYRTLRNGPISYDSEEGCTFNTKEHFKAALVALGPKEKPVYIPLDCITPF